MMTRFPLQPALLAVLMSAGVAHAGFEDLLKSAGPGYDQSADDISYQAASGVPHVDFDELQLVRMLEEDEPIPQDTPLEVSGVRVEVWRYRFDREELVLRAEKIAQAFSRGQTGG